jgi:hypothetical protein
MGILIAEPSTEYQGYLQYQTIKIVTISVRVYIKEDTN